MTLSLPFSGSKPQRGEDRVGGGRLGLPPDPVLHPREAFGGLMDVVAVGDVDKGLEQLFEAFGAAKDRRRTGRSASRRAHHRPHCSISLHPSAFLRGSGRIRLASVA
jgi:hypothetical protein